MKKLLKNSVGKGSGFIYNFHVEKEGMNKCIIKK